MKTVVLILGIVHYLSINAHPIKNTCHNFESYNSQNDISPRHVFCDLINTVIRNITTSNFKLGDFNYAMNRGSSLSVRLRTDDLSSGNDPPRAAAIMNYLQEVL